MLPKQVITSSRHLTLRTDTSSIVLTDDQRPIDTAEPLTAVQLRQLETYRDASKHELIPRYACEKCNEKSIGTDSLVRRRNCKRCNQEDNRGEVIKFSVENNCDPGSLRDTSRVPPHIAQLIREITPTEEILLARCTPIMCIYMAKNGDQFAYRGNVINLATDRPTIHRILPLVPEQCQILIMRREGNGTNVPAYRDLVVNRNRVLTYLRWLKANNPYYSDIEIDENVNLPEDACIIERLNSVAVPGIISLLPDESLIIHSV